MNRTLEFRVGLVTLVALAFFIWMIVFVSGHNPLESKDYYNIVFPDAGLLQKGDQVRLNGIPIGNVEQIGLQGGKVLVQISINSKIKIRKDAKIVVGDVGLFGTNYIKISQYRTTKNPEYWSPNGLITGSEEPGFEELLQQGQDLVVQAKNTFMSLNQIMSDEEFHNDFKGVFADLKESTESTKRLFSKTEKKVGKILTDVSDITGSLEEDADSVGDKAVMAMERLNNVLGDLETISRENKDNIDKAIENLTKMVEQFNGDGQAVKDLRAVLDNLKNVTGTLKTFADDVTAEGETAEKIRSVTNRVEVVTSDLAEVTGSVKEFVLDPETKQDIKQAFEDVNSLASNIDSATSAVSTVKFKLQAALYYSGKVDDYRSDFIANVQKDNFLFRLGFEDVGEDDGINVVQVGMIKDRFVFRTGLISDEMGIGVDANVGRKNTFRFSVEAFDPDDVVWRAIGSYRVVGGTRLALWHQHGPIENVTYGGIQQEF